MRYAIKLRSSLANPLGITILLLSATLALALAFVPAFRALSDRAVWIALLGVFAYLASTVITAITTSEPADPALRDIRKFRQDIVALRRDRIAADAKGKTSEIARILGNAIENIDTRLEPAVRKLIARHKELADRLDRYVSGTLTQPDSEMMARVRTSVARLEGAIDDCTRQAANAHAALLLLLQEKDDEFVATWAERWARELRYIVDAIDELVQGPDDPIRPAEARTAEAPTPIASIAEFERAVRSALPQINEIGALARSPLIDLIPHTLEAIQYRRAPARAASEAPLDKGNALRTALVAAIDRLQPGESGGDVRSAQYTILYEEYVLGHGNQAIQKRLSISPATFYRYQDRAIAAIALDIRHREESLAGEANLASARPSRDGERRPPDTARPPAGGKQRPTPESVRGAAPSGAAGLSERYVFLSYASQDWPKAEPIVERLSAAGIRVWLDQKAIKAGKNYGKEIADGIRGCQALLICCSAAAMRSRNVRQEILLAWKYERPYLPLMIETVEIPHDLAYFLEGWQWIDADGRPDSEWLAGIFDALQEFGISVPGETPTNTPG